MFGIVLLAATCVFLLGFGQTAIQLMAGRVHPGRWNFFAIFAGFLLLTWDLWARGIERESCPIGSLNEVLLFLSWAIAFFYMVVGPAFRLSLLGTFTSPLILLLLVAAQLIPGEPPRPRGGHFFWIELHAALSLMAYGAFAMSAVSGVMFLVQDRQLKLRRAGSLFYNMPPVTDLIVANWRLTAFGLVLLTAGFGAGFLSGMTIHSGKFMASVAIWGLYGLSLALQLAGRLGPRRAAWVSAGIFAVALILLPGIQYLSNPA